MTAQTQHVLLVAKLMPVIVERLRGAVPMLDGRDPAERERLVAEYAGSIVGIATSGHDGASRALMEALPKLRIIACFSAGVDCIDVAAAAELGIPVSSTSEALADDVADLAIAKCLLVLRRLAQADRFVRDGLWATGDFPLGRSLRGLRLGIIGLGTIGQAIATRALAMGMSVAYTARSRRTALPHAYEQDAAALAAACDILVVCCPATPETFHLVDADVLAALGPDGVLVNIARGSVVDEAALVSALAEGRIAGAGLDVFEDEPRPHQALLAMDNVSLSPHIGSGTHQTRARMGEMMIASLLAHLA